MASTVVGAGRRRHPPDCDSGQRVIDFIHRLLYDLGMTGQTNEPADLPPHPTQAEIVASLEGAILSGRMATGTKLPSERAFAERSGISRTALREALRTLAARNLVEIVPGRGAFVRQPRSTDGARPIDTLLRRSQATPRHLVEARIMLEATSAALAAERAERGEIGEMADAIDELNHTSDPIRQARYDMAFHLAIAHASRNPVIEIMFGAIVPLSVELMLRSLTDASVADVSLPYHQRILDAIRQREPESARLAMTEHLAVADRTYGADYDRTLESVARDDLVRLLAPGHSLDDMLNAALTDPGPAIRAHEGARGAHVGAPEPDGHMNE